jgi:hypothetical protein
MDLYFTIRILDMRANQPKRKGFSKVRFSKVTKGKRRLTQQILVETFFVICHPSLVKSSLLVDFGKTVAETPSWVGK